MFSDPTNDHPEVIARLGVSTAILNRDWQFFEGSTLLVFQDHLTELHHATPKLQHQFIDDAARVAAALTKTFPDIKLNHGLFGNAEPHLHWHMIVRRETDPTPRTTIWESDFPIIQSLAYTWNPGEGRPIPPPTPCLFSPDEFKNL